MNVRVTGEVEMRWGVLLAALLRHTAEAPVAEFAEYDADKLFQAGNNILIRLQEEKDKSCRTTLSRQE